MNARQAAKAAAKRIEELERVNALYAVDVQAYWAIIEGTVDGKSICEWCEEQEECQKDEKGGKGCHDWMLMWNRQEEAESDEEVHDGDPGADLITGVGPSGTGTGDMGSV